MFNIVIVGATGQVGKPMIDILCRYPIKNGAISLISSTKSLNKVAKIGRFLIKIDNIGLRKNNIDIIFFMNSSRVSKRYISVISKKCAFIIDSSSYMRNFNDIIINKFNKHGMGIFTVSNCVVSALAMLKNVIGTQCFCIYTYQSISGLGNKGIKSFYKNIKCYLANNSLLYSSFSTNLIIGRLFYPNGSNREESKVLYELKRLFILPNKVKCSRVPTCICHDIVVNINHNRVNLLQKNYMYTYMPYGTNIVLIKKITHAKDKIQLWIKYDNIIIGNLYNSLKHLKLSYQYLLSIL